MILSDSQFEGVFFERIKENQGCRRLLPPWFHRLLRFHICISRSNPAIHPITCLAVYA